MNEPGTLKSVQTPKHPSYEVDSFYAPAVYDVPGYLFLEDAKELFIDFYARLYY